MEAKTNPLADELREAAIRHQIRDSGPTSEANVMFRGAAAIETTTDALRLVEARLTAVARAFYGDGKRSSLAAALDGWQEDAKKARAAIGGGS